MADAKSVLTLQEEAELIKNILSDPDDALSLRLLTIHWRSLDDKHLDEETEH